MTVEQQAVAYADAKSTAETHEVIKDAYLAGARQTLRDIWEKNKCVHEDEMGDLRLCMESFMGMSRLSLIGPVQHAIMLPLEHLKNERTDATLVIMCAVALLHKCHPQILQEYQKYLDDKMGTYGSSVPYSPSVN